MTLPRGSVLTLLLLAVVVNARSAYRDSSRRNNHVQKLDDYSAVRYHEVHYSDGSIRAKGRGSAAVRSGMTQDQMQDVIDTHNTLRAGEGASNMEVLRWNTHLAAMAQRWADRCVWVHGQPEYDVSLHGHRQIGQNIWANSSSQVTAKDGVQTWFNEKSDYNYDSNSCNPGQMCGHYTQVTWGETREIGCGWTNCGSVANIQNANFLVCNYGPAGNWPGRKPFKKGPACTECHSGAFFCTNDLCDSECSSAGSDSCQCKANCGNCGSATSDCECLCKPGWTGVSCDEECKDNDQNCGANPGWPTYWCDTDHQEVLDKCPKMCNLCEVAVDGQSCSKSGNSRDELLDLIEKLRSKLRNV
jgi:hypothetical protein